jgi:hypothetical protein
VTFPCKKEAEKFDHRSLIIEILGNLKEGKLRWEEKDFLKTVQG